MVVPDSTSSPLAHASNRVISWLLAEELTDADVAALRDDLQLDQRRAAMRSIAGWIAANGPLRTEGSAAESVEAAAAILWTLTSPEVHQMLRQHWGWTPAAYESWLRHTLESSLLP